MEKYAYSQDIIIRQRASFFRKIINISIITLVSLSVAYFVFWLGVVSDDILLKYMGAFFTPLAEFLNSSDYSIAIYQKTSFKLISFIIPFVFAYIVVGKFEENAIKQYFSNQEKQQKELKRQQDMYKKMRAETTRGKFSICLSMEYSSEKKLSMETIRKLNKAIFVKIHGVISNFIHDVYIVKNQTIVIVSNNYDKYDFIYSSLLKTLAVIKNSIENKFDLLLIPSITTDAVDRVVLDDIVDDHFDIQNFNLKNRAVVTAEFARRYSNLQHKKYSSIPIGEFMSTNRQTPHELNLVYKDLNKVLVGLNNSSSI